jgi:hypothetical protein
MMRCPLLWHGESATLVSETALDAFASKSTMTLAGHGRLLQYFVAVIY